MGLEELSMLTAFTIIVIILLSGGARSYFKHKYDPSKHLKKMQEAIAENDKGKRRIQNVQALHR